MLAIIAAIAAIIAGSAVYLALAEAHEARRAGMVGKCSTSQLRATLVQPRPLFFNPPLYWLGLGSQLWQGQGGGGAGLWAGVEGDGVQRHHAPKVLGLLAPIYLLCRPL